MTQMTLTQVLRGMASYLTKTLDPIDRERWALTLRDTANEIERLKQELVEAHYLKRERMDRIIELTHERDQLRQERDEVRKDRDDWAKAGTRHYQDKCAAEDALTQARILLRKFRDAHRQWLDDDTAELSTLVEHIIAPLLDGIARLDVLPGGRDE